MATLARLLRQVLSVQGDALTQGFLLPQGGSERQQAVAAADRSLVGLDAMAVVGPIPDLALNH